LAQAWWIFDTEDNQVSSIMSAVIALGDLVEEDYMRLVKMALEPKDRLVLQAGCQHDWRCYGKPATIFHDRGKIFTSDPEEDARIRNSTQILPRVATSLSKGVRSVSVPRDIHFNNKFQVRFGILYEPVRAIFSFAILKV